jgi:glycine cleavage system regulatory protein
MQSLVFTAIGPDRPGLVEELSTVVASNGGNWLESKMAHFCGEFAGIVRVEAEDAGPLRAALEGIEGLKVVLSDAADSCPIPAETVTLELTGSDRPGIVSEITRALAAQGVNVEDLETELVSAPMSGEQLFTARAELGLPEGLALDALQSALEAVASDLMVDLTLV